MVGRHAGNYGGVIAGLASVGTLVCSVVGISERSSAKRNSM